MQPKHTAGRKALILVLIFLFAAILSGCSGSSAVTRYTVRERPDSLIIRGDSIAFSAHSDTLNVDSVKAVIVGEPDTSAVSQSVAPPTPRTVSTLYRSVKARKDTTIGRFRIRLGYQWPGDLFTFQIMEGDTSVHWVVRDSLVERPYEVEVVPFWAKLVLGIALIAVAGMFVALVKR